MIRASLLSTKPAVTLGVVLFLTLGTTLPAFGNALSKIKNGEIIVHSVPAKKGPDTGRAMGMIEAPADVVADVLSRFDRYSEFVPRIVGSRKVKDDRFVVKAELPWPVNSAWVYVHLTRKDSGRTSFLRWKMLNGTFKAYEGMAWIQPIDARRTLLTYQTLAVPKTRAPDGLISKGLRSASKSMVKAIRDEAAREMARRSVKTKTRRVATQGDGGGTGSGSTGSGGTGSGGTGSGSAALERGKQMSAQ